MERARNPYKPGTSSHRIVALALKGLSNKVIAERLGFTTNYVSTRLGQWRNNKMIGHVNSEWRSNYET